MPLIRKGKMEMRKNKAGRKLFGGKPYLPGFSLWRGSAARRWQKTGSGSIS
jgi:hypothetical protein